MSPWKPDEIVEKLRQLKDRINGSVLNSALVDLPDGQGSDRFEYPRNVDSVRTLPLGTKGKLTLNGEAGIDYRVRVFNSRQDKDDDEIWTFKEGTAVLKHELQASLGGEAAVPPTSLGSVGLGAKISGKSRVRMMHYRPHAAKEKVAGALLDDLTSLRLIVRPDDVADLVANGKPGEVLAFDAQACFGFEFSLTWGEALAATSSWLESALWADGAIALDVSIGAKLTFDAALNDELRVVFRRKDATTAQVSLKKCKQSTRTLGGNVGVEAKLRDPKVVSDALIRLLIQASGLVATDSGALADALAAKQPFEKLTPKQQSAAAKLFEKLGVDYDGLWKRLLEESASLQARIESAAQQKVQLGFQFKYQSITLARKLLDCEINITTPLGQDLLGGALLGAVEPIVFEGRKGGGVVKLNEYFGEQIETKRRSYGLLLQFGKHAFGSSEKRLEEQTEREDKDGNVSATYSSSLLCEDTWGEASAVEARASWVATTGGFVVHLHPSQLRHALELSWTTKEKSLSKGELGALLDLASLWGVLQSGWRQDESLQAKMDDIVGSKSSCSITLVATDEAVVDMLRLEAATLRHRFLNGLAAGLMWSDEALAHFSPKRRQLFYRATVDSIIESGEIRLPNAGDHNELDHPYSSTDRNFDILNDVQFRDIKQFRQKVVNQLRDLSELGRLCAPSADGGPASVTFKKLMANVMSRLETPVMIRAFGFLVLSMKPTHRTDVNGAMVVRGATGAEMLVFNSGV